MKSNDKLIVLWHSHVREMEIKESYLKKELNRKEFQDEPEFTQFVIDNITDHLMKKRWRIIDKMIDNQNYKGVHDFAYNNTSNLALKVRGLMEKNTKRQYIKKYLNFTNLSEMEIRKAVVKAVLDNQDILTYKLLWKYFKLIINGCGDKFMIHSLTRDFMSRLYSKQGMNNYGKYRQFDPTTLDGIIVLTFMMQFALVHKSYCQST